MRHGFFSIMAHRDEAKQSDTMSWPGPLSLKQELYTKTTRNVTPSLQLTPWTEKHMVHHSLEMTPDMEQPFSFGWIMILFSQKFFQAFPGSASISVVWDKKCPSWPRPITDAACTHSQSCINTFQLRIIVHEAGYWITAAGLNQQSSTDLLPHNNDFVSTVVSPPQNNRLHLNSHDTYKEKKNNILL